MKLALLASTVLAVSLIPFAAVDAQERGQRGDRGRDNAVVQNHRGHVPGAQIERGLPSSRNETQRLQQTPDKHGYGQQHGYVQHAPPRHGYDNRRGNRSDRGHNYNQGYVYNNYRHGQGWQPPRHRAPIYAPPRGYQARHWQAGYYLPASYRTHHYVVDYGYYQLAPPPRGYHYIRVDDNVVLAAIATGLISEVLFNLFYR